MRKIVTALSGTVVAVILLFGYRTSTSSGGTGTAVAAATTPTTGTGSTTPSATPSTGATTTGATKTYDGTAADTRWGVVQVRITVQNGKITSSTTLQVPANNPRDQEINSYAVPILDQEVVTAQSAQIDSVSGATVTSGGYQESLQAAVDAAGI